MGNMTMTAAPASTQASRPRAMRRAVAAPALSNLHGAHHGTLLVPRRLYWSGGADCGQVNLANEDEIALAYESIIETARTSADLVEHLNAELLIRVWPTLGIAPARRAAWEASNPELTLTQVLTAAPAVLWASSGFTARSPGLPSPRLRTARFTDGTV
jgi:hypothetical protein